MKESEYVNITNYTLVRFAIDLLYGVEFLNKDHKDGLAIVLSNLADIRGDLFKQIEISEE